MTSDDGHVFVVGADLTRLACDDVVVPRRSTQVDQLLRRLGGPSG